MTVGTDCYDGVLYRNQFVIGPRHLDFPAWQKIQVRRGFVITAHPELACHQAVDGQRALTLVGFMLDPDDEHRTDEDIVDELLATGCSARAIIAETYRYAGRWLLIADDGERLVMFNDAAGLRQVFHSMTDEGLWCASQPGMLAQILGLQIGPDALRYIDSFGFRADPEYWWPGCGSPFTGVHHLMPNHILDGVTGAVTRYWPDKPVPALSLGEAVDMAVPVLRGIVKSAANRFDLAVGITAGWDSRVALAAAREVASRLSFVTVRQWRMRDDHPDVAVPAALLSRLGLRHDVIRSSVVVDPEFVRIFRTNYALAHDHYAPDVQAILRYSGLQKANLTGHVSETVRNPSMGNPPITVASTDRDIARAWHRSDDPYAVEAVRGWRSTLGQTYNVRPGVLFYWEQRVANWLAMTHLEFDAGWREIVSLYNCRALLITMLGVDESQRGTVLYRKLARAMWPEVLDVPVNPHKSVKARIRRWVRKLPLVWRWRATRA